ncbi:MAG: hypothetical protein KDC43_20270 [Saprospiraceae bacterium]|nr:hypothetical protein [Saprospiraceae bacterium]MCB0626182.1 hypothetical protein [Saprospiraceae bacterium]MCB0681756.1 hypothetical protein [Saprospiraceae bacterium]
MHRSIPLFMLLALTSLLLGACKKETEVVRETVPDNYIYEINGQTLYQSNVEKTKQKSSEQYISILYANLFQSTIPPNDLANLTEVRLANGDKQLADELILNSYINSGSAIVPTDADMRADIDQFVENTYIRFFLRKPTPYELHQLREAIESDPGLSPELIYQGFALSSEYQFY